METLERNEPEAAELRKPPITTEPDKLRASPVTMGPQAEKDLAREADEATEIPDPKVDGPDAVDRVPAIVLKSVTDNPLERTAGALAVREPAIAEPAALMPTAAVRP